MNACSPPETTEHTFTTAQMFTPGGGGRIFAEFMYIYTTNSPQKKMELTGAGLTLVALPYGCPSLRLPFLKVALPLVGQAPWLLLCIYSYEVEAV